MKKKKLVVVLSAVLLVGGIISGIVFAATASDTADITASEAKSIALSHAGLTESEVTFARAELDRDDGKLVYEVEFYNGSTEYDYSIDAVTGEIVSCDYDVENYVIPSDNTDSTTAAPSASSAGITADEAKASALSHAGLTESEVTFVRAELDQDDGGLAYEVEFYNGSTEYDYDIDAATGEILSYGHDVGNHTASGTKEAASGGEYIGEDAAKAIALEKVSGATDSDIRIYQDYDDGIVVYEGSIVYSEMEYEFEIRATDGAILEWNAESVYDD